MSRIVVCAVWDSAVQAYARPIFVPTAAVAQRSFRDEVNRVASDNQMHAHPEDFELWCLGEFDDEAGVFDKNVPAMVVRGKDVVDPV